MISLDIFVPPDERFSSKKLSDFISSSAQAAVYCLSHEAKQLFQQESDDYNSFDEVHNMFSGNRSRSQEVEGWITEKLKNVLPAKLFKEVTDVNKKNPQKFPIPQIIAGDSIFQNSYRPLQKYKIILLYFSSFYAPHFRK